MARKKELDPRMEVRPYVPPGETVVRFHKSDKFVRGVRGPVGSGKSSSCMYELFTRGVEQRPWKDGVRRTRFGVVRNTYPELRTTALKTFGEWFPFAEICYGQPISAKIQFELPDKTRVEQEWYFISMDEPKDVNKLKSFEFTGIFLNEASGLLFDVLDIATRRLRYPSVAMGGATWRGVVMDTNPPDSDSWWYEHERAPGPEFEFFIQPPAMLRNASGWEDNPNADNAKNLEKDYYRRQLSKNDEYNRVYIGNEFGTLSSGRPVYPMYNDAIHSGRVAYVPGWPVIVGLDYGRDPAAIFTQLSPRGQLRCFHELFSDDTGVATFARDILKPYVATTFGYDADVQFSGDPAGIAKESDERSAFDVLVGEGIYALPAHTNRLPARLDSVIHYLTKLCDGQPGFLLDKENCDLTRRGFLGRYCYARVAMSGGVKYKDIPDKSGPGARYTHLQDALHYAALRSRMDMTSSKDWNKPLMQQPWEK